VISKPLDCKQFLGCRDLFVIFKSIKMTVGSWQFFVENRWEVFYSLDLMQDDSLRTAPYGHRLELMKNCS
jgi:hypothetical protein